MVIISFYKRKESICLFKDRIRLLWGKKKKKNDIISTQSNQERRIQAEYSEDRNFSHEENPLLENSGVVSQSDELEEHHSNY